MVVINPLRDGPDNVGPRKAAEVVESKFRVSRIEVLESPIVRLKIDGLILAYFFPSAPPPCDSSSSPSRA